MDGSKGNAGSLFVYYLLFIIYYLLSEEVTGLTEVGGQWAVVSGRPQHTRGANAESVVSGR
jgi:hypothetical protein